MERNRKIIRVSIVGIAANMVLVVFKALVGLAVNSAAIISDALNNLSDALSSIVTIIGAKIAGRAPNKKHPYGYGQIEYVSSVIVAALILYTGIQSFMDGLDKVLSGTKTNYDAAAILVVAGAIIVKLLLGRYTKRQGQDVHSEALIGSGTDAMFDALASSSILVSAVLSLIFDISIDGWLGMGIAVLILKAGLDILLESMNGIIGTRIDSRYAETIKKTVCSFPEVEGAYDLVLNRYGPERTIGSVHIQVPDEMSARQIDHLSRQIQARIYTQYGIILTVGIYARNESDPKARAIHDRLVQIVSQYPQILQMHGFYLDTRTKTVSFDIIVDFSSDDAADIRKEILEKIQKEFPEYHFSAVLDSDFSD